MPPLLVGVILFAGFFGLGLGPALWLRARTALPPRYLGLLALLSTSAASSGVFWAAFYIPRSRLALVGLLVALSCVLAWRALRRDARWLPLAEPAAWGPPLLSGLLTIAYLWPLLTSGPPINDRFSWKLPSDNILPGLFAARVTGDDGPTRPIQPLWPGGDRASERPPLQAAIVATIGSMVRGGDQEYQLLATICQAQWLPSLLLVGVVCGLKPRALAVVLAACAVSGFFFVNTIYAWPKLLAAALMLGGLAVTLEPEPADRAAARARAVVVAALVALSLLAHPGPAFTLLAIPVCWPILRPIIHVRPTWPAAAIGVTVAAALVAPWLAYQTFVDPPTGRLLREHLSDGRDGPLVQAIAAANLERPLVEHVTVRLGNLAAQLGRPWLVLWPADPPAVQREQFFHHGASLGLLLGGLVVTLGPWRARDDPAADAVRRLAWFALAALAVWSLVVFPAGGALIHHGSPVTTALLFFAGAYGLTRLPWGLQLIALGLHAAAFLLIWALPILRTAHP